MGFEGHGDGGSVDGIGLFNDFMKQSLMADMDAIEITNGDGRIFKRLRKIFETIDNFHKRFASNMLWPNGA